MPRKRGANVLNEKLRKEFAFIKTPKSESDVHCEVCNTGFSIVHSGRRDIESHIKSKNHHDALHAASSSHTLKRYLKSSTLSEHDAHIASCEGVWAFHMINSNHRFHSADCASKIIRSCFAMVKFSCARTKCEAIATGVFAPYVLRELKKDLNDCHFFTILTDASNHGSTKMFPVLVRFFSEKEGVKVKVVDLVDERGETSEIIVNLLNAAMSKFNINKKLVAFCGDNAACNFGNFKRSGKNNVFYKLKQLYPGLIGVGCAAHIVHNTLKKACDKMPFDVEMIVVKIYSHFYLFTVRVAKLEDFCKSVDVEYKKLLGYSKSRFLGLLSSVGSILRIFDGLKEYFLGDPNSPNALITFFEDPMAKVWLLFLHDQACLFNRTVKAVEGDNINAMEVGHALNVFAESLKSRKNSAFLSTTVQKEIELVSAVVERVSKEQMQGLSRQFYESSIDYIEKWIEQFDHIMIFAWCSLVQPPEWKFIEGTAKYIATNNHFDLESSDTDLFDQFTLLEKYVTADKILSWEENSTATDQRWVECFLHFEQKKVPYNHMLTIVSYVLSLPGTSATVERVFSFINQIWSDDKSQLKIETLRDLLYVRYNIKMTCTEFFEFLKKQPQMLNEIASDGKYAFKKTRQGQ